MCLGLAAGLCLQIHLSGALAIGLAGLAILPRLRGETPRQLAALVGLACLGLVISYLPYLVVDAAHGFANTHHLRSGRANHQLFGVASGRSFASFFQFASQSDAFRPEAFRGFAPTRDALGTLTFYLAIPLTLAGGLLGSPLRLVGTVGLLLVPAFFAVTGRDYLVHYVAAGAPFYVLPSAVALGALLATRWRPIAAGYLAFFLALGVVDVCAEYSRQAEEWQLDDQLAIAGELADRTSSAHLVPGSLLDWQAPLYEWLARDALGRSLSMTGKTPCGIYASEAEAARLGPPAFRGRHWVACGTADP